MRVSDCKSWGVDVGNVLLKNIPYETRRLFVERGASPETIVSHMYLLPDALLGLRFLVHHVGKENVWIISKANHIENQITRLVFDKFKVYNTTGLDPEQVLFVPTRPDKIPVIRTLELDGMIDDRGEIISAAQDFIHCPIWFRPTPADSDLWCHDMGYKVRVVSSWHQLIGIFST